jgi:hypothetical protein
LALISLSVGFFLRTQFYSWAGKIFHSFVQVQPGRETSDEILLPVKPQAIHLYHSDDQPRSKKCILSSSEEIQSARMHL